jgi:hypothetical protein
VATRLLCLACGTVLVAPFPKGKSWRTRRLAHCIPQLAGMYPILFFIQFSTFTKGFQKARIVEHHFVSHALFKFSLHYKRREISLFYSQARKYFLILKMLRFKAHSFIRLMTVQNPIF